MNKEEWLKENYPEGKKLWTNQDLRNCREELREEFEKMIEEFVNPENLNLSWSDVSINCPKCDKLSKCWSRLKKDNHKDEVCLNCRFRELLIKIKEMGK